MWHEFGERLQLRESERPEWTQVWSPPTFEPPILQNQILVQNEKPKENKWKTFHSVVKASQTIFRSRKPASWRSFKEVSVSGIDATLDRKSPMLRRFLWGIVLVICTALMVAQCLDRIVRYIDEPVNVNVRITHNDSLEFPSVTICNKNPFNRTAALHLLVKNEILPINSTEAQVNVSMLVGVNGMTASDVWTTLAHDRNTFIEQCWFGRGKRCDLSGEWTAVHTVIGPCYAFTLNDIQVNTFGTFNNLYIALHETTPEAPIKGEIGARVLLHEKQDSPILLARTHSMSAELGWSREVKLELRKFQTLNTAKSPCIEDPEYSEAKCHSDCFQRAMYEVSKCRMPYMPHDPHLGVNVTECSNPYEYEEAMNAVANMLLMGAWTVHDCDCQHECHETTYLAYPENMSYMQNRSRLRIYFGELVFEQIDEEMAYTMISLLCDIGGTLGLLLGASVLTVCELLEVVWSRFIQRCCRLEDRQAPKLKPKMSRAFAKLHPTSNKLSPTITNLTSFANNKLIG